jgi:hypothetical protein
MLLSYLATTMTLLRSPILIPQHSYEIRNYRLRVDKNEAKRAEVKCCIPDFNKETATFRESAVQILAKKIKSFAWLLLITLVLT